MKRVNGSGSWESIYIVEGFLRKASELQPAKVRADTQRQPGPVFAILHLLGIKLLPRISRWKELIFYRPAKETNYEYIDPLFTETT